jgi:hypothetical protein
MMNGGTENDRKLKADAERSLQKEANQTLA